MDIQRTEHEPVLMKEAIDALNLKSGMTVVDATLGGGGYTKLIFEKIQSEGKVIAVDQDASAIARFTKYYPSLAGVIDLAHDNFSAVEEILRERKIEHVDAVVADLGLSSDQLVETDRGFSFQRDEPLDMRMDQTSGVNAADVVNTFSETAIVEILRDYAQEKYARAIVRAIVKKREEKEIVSTTELADIISHAVPPAYRHGRIHPATRTFQALRIYVNDELQHIERFLVAAIRVLKKGARLVVITFHSGEDKIVKEVFRAHARGCMCPESFPVCLCGHTPDVRIIAPRSGIVPQAEEITRNPRARSARLRVVEKL